MSGSIDKLPQFRDSFRKAGSFFKQCIAVANQDDYCESRVDFYTGFKRSHTAKNHSAQCHQHQVQYIHAKTVSPDRPKGGQFSPSVVPKPGRIGRLQYIETSTAGLKWRCNCNMSSQTCAVVHPE